MSLWASVLFGLVVVLLSLEMAGKVHAFEKILASDDSELVVVGYAFNPYIILAIYVAAEASIY